MPVADISPASVCGLTDRPLRASTKLFYGIGEIGITANMVVTGLFILFFYNSVMKLPAVLVGIGFAAGLICDAIVGPYIGYRSDNCVNRLGRRHLYMLAGAPAMGISLWLLLCPPRNLGTAALFLWLLGTTLLFRLTNALYRIPYLSLGAEMSQDYDERTSIAGIRSFFGLGGTLTAASLAFVLFFPNKIPGVNPKLDYASYPKMGLAFGAALTLSGLLAVTGTLPYRSASRSRVAACPVANPTTFLRGVSLALRNAPFRSIWLSFSLFFLAVVLNSVVSIHFFTWYVHIIDSRILSRIQLCFYLGAMGGVALWVWVSKHVEKRPAYFGAVMATACLMCAATQLFGEGHLFGTQNPRPLLYGNALAGLFASALWVLPASMLADVADHDEVNTGLRREGMFFGIMDFGEKIAASFSLLISGALLGYYVHLAPGEVQNPAASSRIGVVYGLLPGIILVTASLIILGYRLDRRRVLAIQVELKGLREQAASVPGDPDPCRG